MCRKSTFSLNFVNILIISFYIFTLSFFPYLSAHDLKGAIASDLYSVVVLDEYGPTRMIRTQSLKYVHRYQDGPHEFYDLANDPNETVNAINDPAFRSIIRHMRNQLQDWFERYTEPERDGAKQDVMGRGQIDLVDGNRQAFAQDITFMRDL